MNNQHARKIIVVGGGLTGVTTAHRLCELNHHVTLIEAKPGLGEGAGFANGAMLCPSMAEPWNAPGVMRTLLTSIVDSASPMKLRLRAIPSLLGWGLSFVRHASVQRYQDNVEQLYKLARYSVECCAEYRERCAEHYDAQACGTLKVFRDSSGFEASKRLAERHKRFGMRFELLDGEQTIKKEPRLTPLRNEIVGALYFPDDEVGDAHKFCCKLGEEIIELGGVIRTGTPAERILLDSGRVCGVQVSGQELSADTVVLCLGSDPNSIARRAGVNLPIKPVKGYSITFETRGINAAPKVPVIDDALHAAVVPLGDRLRVVGTAEFTGHDGRLTQSRIDNLRNLLKRIYPELAPKLLETNARQWTGFRPVSDDGLPFIGASKRHGLWINMGHGHLGWTMSVGSAHLLGDLLEAKKPAIDPKPFSVTR